MLALEQALPGGRSAVEKDVDERSAGDGQTYRNSQLGGAAHMDCAKRTARHVSESETAPVRSRA